MSRITSKSRCAPFSTRTGVSTSGTTRTEELRRKFCPPSTGPSHTAPAWRSCHESAGEEARTRVEGAEAVSLRGARHREDVGGHLLPLQLRDRLRARLRPLLPPA